MSEKIPKIELSEYDFLLPSDRIAKFPLEDRASSRLLYFDGHNINHKNFRELPELLDSGTHLILNNTKVIPARIHVLKDSGAKVEILPVDPILPSTDPTTAMMAKGECKWRCMIGGRNVKIGLTLKLPEDRLGFSAKVLSREMNYGEILFNWDENYTFSELISLIGKIPLPPYIAREADENDKERYQTVYARHEGSIAAPTAGLHFTDEVMAKLSNKGIRTNEILLHVGPGTFIPINSAEISNHDMHKEMFTVTKSTILAIYESIESGKRICAVGTTSVRTLESIYWLGLKISKEEMNNQTMFLDRFEAYNSEYTIEAKESLNNILNYMEKNKLDTLTGMTRLFIIPGYKFKFVDIVVTNFHLPKSTLILLIAAFIGKENIKKVYDEAIEHKYRFLSYGDSSLLYKSE